MGALLSLLVALYFLGIGWGHAADNKRLALVIANSQYKHAAPLKNPPNDARLIATKLRDLGFTVQVETDLDAMAFSRVVEGFASKLDKTTDALFYYAGHGLEYQGANYLVAVNAKLQSEATIQFETFSLNTVIGLIERQASTALVFWDGCRNNPVANGLQATRLTLRTDSAGAVRVSAPIPPSRKDIMVMFSAEPGKFAVEGSGDVSPFAEALAKHVATPNIEIEKMLKRVTADVSAKTNNFQQPQMLSQLAKEFYFKQQQEKEQVAYKQEIATLLAKIALLESRRVPETRFEIVPSASASQQSPVTQMAPPAVQSGAPGPPAAIHSEIVAAPRPTFGKSVKPEASAAPEPAPVEISLPPAPPPPAAVANAAAPSHRTAPAEASVVVSVNPRQSTIIRKLKVSADGRLLAIGGDDGIIRVVSLDTFEVIQIIRAHEGRISDIDFAPNSRTLLSAGRDGFLRFWDARSGKSSRAELTRAGFVPYTARFNPEFPDRYVLMGDRAGRLSAWDLARGDKIVVNAKFHNGPVQSVAYQPAGKGTYLSAGADGLLKIRLPEGKRSIVNAHAGPIFAAGYNQKGSLVYTAGADRKIRIWDPGARNRKDPVAVLEGHLKYVLAAVVSQDGKLLASGGGDKVVNLWDVASHKLIGRLSGHTSDIEALAFTPNNRFVISASEDRTVRIWPVDGQKELARMFFKKDTEKYAGVTYDNKSFGDKDTDVMAIFVDGKAVAENKTELNYVGHGISVVDAQK
ncbi:MAG: caspase family protein [Pseudomonadota bacterium]